MKSTMVATTAVRARRPTFMAHSLCRKGRGSNVTTRGAGNARGNRQRAHACDLGRRLALRTQLSVTQKQASPVGRLRPAFEDTAIDERPAVEIVVDVAREDEAVDER